MSTKVKSTATVFVVEDDADMRESIKRVLDSVSLPVESYADASEFLKAYKPQRPGCLLVDLRLPGTSGVALLEELRQRGDRLPAVALTAYGEVPSTVRVMRSGAIDVIEKPFRAQALIDRVHEAIELDWRQREDAERRKAATERLQTLTAREREVLGKLYERGDVRSVAKDMGLSIKTVHTHRANMMRKTGTRSTVSLLRLALDAGTACGGKLALN
mgnify:CR=1 FL=1